MMGEIVREAVFSCISVHNKDKSVKYRVDFFILADAKYYFIYHLGFYQGKNKANIRSIMTLTGTGISIWTIDMLHLSCWLSCFQIIISE